VDEDGFLRHTDRKKDIYKSSSGRTVAPQRVEALFADFPEVSRVFAVGDGRDYVTLLIRPNVAYEQVDFEGLSREALHEYFRGLVVSCNRFLAPFERVVNFAVIDRDFSQEEGDLTQKGSFRRFNVVESFRDLIEPMYATAWIERPVDGLRVRIPVAFLQHLGVTESDVREEADGIAFLGADRKLRIRRDRDIEGRVWVGNCAYEGVPHVLDLDHWLRIPKLWVGNAELTLLTGEAVLLWTLSGDDRVVETEMVAVERSERALAKWPERLHTSGDREPGLLDVHAAAVVLSSSGGDQASHAIRLLTRVMRTGRLQHQELAESRLQTAWRHPETGVRGKAFVSLWKHQAPLPFRRTATLFCESLNDFLDDEACERLASLAYAPEKWRSFGRALTAQRQRLLASQDPVARDHAARLLRSLARIAVSEEDYYLPVRRQLAAWLLTPAAELVRAAGEALDEIKAAFRKRLGPRTHEAVDPDTRKSYGWGDTLRFEDGLDPADVERIASAVRETDLVREAAYLLHRRRIDLADLAPGSIWVRIAGTWFGRTVYTAAVRPRSRDRCDFVLYLKGAGVPVEDFLTDLRLTSVGAGDPGRVPLTPQLAGYWPEYGLAALEHVPGQSLQALTLQTETRSDPEARQRVIGAWEHLAWSALTAAFRFLRRTDGRWMLTGNLAREVSVPLNDYDERTRVLSTAGWRRFRGKLDALLRLSRGFLEPVRFHFPALRAVTPDDLLFAAVLEAFGLREGLAFLKDAAAEAGVPEEQPEEVRALCRRLRDYVARVEEQGYMPRALRFAIARYHEWAKQVPSADVHTRAAQLRELRSNYRIEAVARRFPGSRLWFYAETVLHGAPEEGQALMRRAIGQLRDGQPIREVLGRLYRDVRDKLPQYDHQYFLARAAYPHLDPDEKAQLVTTAEAGTSRAELATVHSDAAGRELRIRPVADARELDALYRLFYSAGMGRGLTGEEGLLVALDPAGYVVGGIAYIARTPHHVLFDKVVVLPRFRGLGIGSLLTREFIRRLEAERVAIVSSEFIRAEWLGRFGFRPHPNHAGVVLLLAPEEAEEDPDAQHDDHD
jgi:ribosomal protein S18 acetylase RimI-like enzyme